MFRRAVEATECQCLVTFVSGCSPRLLFLSSFVCWVILTFCYLPFQISVVDRKGWDKCFVKRTEWLAGSAGVDLRRISTLSFLRHICTVSRGHWDKAKLWWGWTNFRSATEQCNNSNNSVLPLVAIHHSADLKSLPSPVGSKVRKSSGDISPPFK